MGLAFHNLDGVTRPIMVEEIDLDIGGRGLYLSNYLTDDGKARWPALLRDAAIKGTDDSLAAALNAEHCFKQKVERRKPKGGFTLVDVPYTAAQTLAESQFNMYYMRALSRRAETEKKHLKSTEQKTLKNREKSQNA